VGTDRVQTLSVPIDGGLNISSDVMRLETSQTKQVRAFRLRDFFGFFLLPIQFLTQNFAVPLQLETGEERDARIDSNGGSFRCSPFSFLMTLS
jgi:hypothetical protein